VSTLTDLRYVVAAFMNRTPAAFSINGQDLLQQAINNAKRYCQRKLNFEFARVQAKVESVHYLNGGSLTAAKELSTSLVIDVKQIRAAFLTNTGVPILVYSRDKHLQRLRRQLDRLNVPVLEQSTYPVTYPIGLVQMGKTIYVTPPDTDMLGGTTFTVYLDVIKWLPPYRDVITGTASGVLAGYLVDTGKNFVALDVKIGDTVKNMVSLATAVVDNVAATQLHLTGDIFPVTAAYEINPEADHDFLLDYGQDFLVYRSIAELNYFLKEDERVVISAQIVQDSWDSLVKWNDDIIGNTAEIDLD